MQQTECNHIVAVTALAGGIGVPVLVMESAPKTERYPGYDFKFCPECGSKNT
jgi:hypothetical protein